MIMNQENNAVTQVDATTADWEENMIAELATKYDLDENIVLDIGITFVINEMSAAMNGKQALINTIHMPQKQSIEVYK